tara:strand:+ start:850 stop:1740 length:891 start_codon:yes stop_codon:yes gene_type:complete
MTNPYAQENLSIEDMILYGDARNLDVKHERGGDRGHFDLDWHPSYQFQSSVADLGLSPEQKEALLALLPDTMYNYSSLNPQISNMLSSVFSGGTLGSIGEDYFSGMPTGKGGTTDIFTDPSQLESDITRAMIDQDKLDRYIYSVAQYGGDWITDWAAPDIQRISLGEGASFVDIFDPQSIASALSEIKGGGAATKIGPGEVVALTPEQLEKTEGKYYDPILEHGREEATHGLLDTLAKDVTGGLAASAAPAAQKRRAQAKYSSAINKILQDIIKSQASATHDVQSQIMGWKELLSD